MASSMLRFYVLPSNCGDWLIFKEGIQRAVHRLGDKDNAVETAKAMARAEAPSEVIVERRNGILRRYYAFASGGTELH